MKTNKWIFAIMIASLTWVACDDDDNILERETLSDTDETFVEVAAKSNMAEIEFGEMARIKATDSLVRAYAQQMITEHTAAQNELEAISDDYDGIEWPNGLDEGHSDIKDELDNVEGYSFDSLYMTTQVQMHTAAVSAFQSATTNTTNTRVKGYATKYLPIMQMHLEKADSIDTVIMTPATDDGTGTD